MTRLFTYVAAAIIAVSGGIQTAAAANQKPEIRCSSNQPAKVELACGLRAFRHNRGAARWIRHHRTLAVVTTQQVGHNLKYYVWQQKVAKRWVEQARARLHPGPIVPTGFPPHHALWLCIHGIEGNWYDNDTGGSGHYGGLQMSYNWLGYIRGKASDYSQAVQEWAAERAYKASGYAFSFLWGQWYEWENGVGSRCYHLD